MPLSVVYGDSAERSLRKMDPAQARVILRRIDRLAEETGNVDHTALKGRFRGLLKLRVGDYRVTYTVEREAGTLTEHLVGHRSEIYDITSEGDA